MKNIFHLNTNIQHNIRSCSELYCRNPKTVKYGTQTTLYLAPKLWPLVSNTIKRIKLLDLFISKIRQWEPDGPYCLCNIYLQHVGFV